MSLNVYNCMKVAMLFGRLPHRWIWRGRRAKLTRVEKVILRAKTLRGIQINRQLKVKIPKPRVRYRLRTMWWRDEMGEPFRKVWS